MDHTQRQPLPILVCDEFISALDAFTAEKKRQAWEKIRLLATNPFHNSLNAHRIHNAKGLWECYVNEGDRIIYEIDAGTLRLWKIGDHSLIDRVHTRSFAAHTRFRRLEPEFREGTSQLAFQVPPEWLEAPIEQSGNCFASVSSSHLRILGVPAHLINSVREAASIEGLETIEGLPLHVIHWLNELATSPQIDFDPTHLIYRTTLDKLEGYVQGRLQQLMFNLTPDQQQFVDRRLSGPILLRGCAGAGKTSVIIYRAIRHAENGEQVLLLTYSKTLAQALESFIEELIGPLPDNLTVKNLDSWIMAFLNSRHYGLNIVEEEEKDAMLKSAISETKGSGYTEEISFGLPFIRDEIDSVIKANGLTTLEEYGSWQRHGRKRALPNRQRQLIWAVYERYEQSLHQSNKVDWRDPALRAIRELEKQPLAQPYDHVLIDETQDLTGAQFKVAQKIVRYERGQPSLFLVGDSSQTLYTRGFTWKQMGLNLQGLSFNIRRNFRSTRQIAEAAAALLANNETFCSPQEMVDPAQSQREGPRPIVISHADETQGHAFVREHILSLVEDQSFRLADFAILCPTRALCRDYLKSLKMADIPCVEYGVEHADVLENKVKVLTLHAAKGLEFPVVFIVGLKENTLPRPLAHLAKEDAALEIERQRVLLYVGITRAAEALFLVVPKQHSSRFVAEMADTLYYQPLEPEATGR